MKSSTPKFLLVLSMLAATSVVVSPGTTPASAAPDRCTRGDADAIVQAGGQFGTRVLGAQPHGATASSTRKWVECQFRLYDDNDEVADDPEIAHVFSEDDWVVGAIAYFAFASEFPLFGGTREDATAYMDTWIEHLYFGPASLSDADLPEVTLNETSYRTVQFPALGERAVLTTTYIVWPAGSLAPGTYRFRFEQIIPDGPFEGAGEERGTIVITAAP